MTGMDDNPYQSPCELNRGSLPCRPHLISMGGWLSFLNGGFWILLFTLATFAPKFIEPILGLFLTIAIFMSVPLATPYFFVFRCSLSTPTVAEIVIQASVFGTNSLVWGYGIAWLVKRMTRRPDSTVHVGNA
jgi:hypothetical protein